MKSLAPSLCALCLLLCAGCPRARSPVGPDAAAHHVAPRPDAAARAQADSAVVQGFRWAPRWSCGLTGPGRVGRLPAMEITARPYDLEPGAVQEKLTLRDGRVLWRLPVREQGRVVLARGRLELRAPTVANDAGALVTSREFAVDPSAQEALYEEGTSAGVAFFTPQSARLIALDGAEQTLAGPVRTTPCVAASEGLRVVPIGASTWDLPPVRGTPPLVANARWTLGREQGAVGFCVSSLDAEGPWGRLRTLPVDGGLAGELSLDEAANPVRCGPVE